MVDIFRCGAYRDRDRIYNDQHAGYKGCNKQPCKVAANRVNVEKLVTGSNKKPLLQAGPGTE